MPQDENEAVTPKQEDALTELLLKKLQRQGDQKTVDKILKEH